MLPSRIWVLWSLKPSFELQFNTNAAKEIGQQTGRNAENVTWACSANNRSSEGAASVIVWYTCFSDLIKAFKEYCNEKKREQRLQVLRDIGTDQRLTHNF